jgi:predicted dehydrogenase
MKPVTVGIVGCGNISDIYFKNIAKFDNIEVVACADLMVERAQEQAKEYGCRAMSVDELLADASVEVILNLTTPGAHYEIDTKALKAGKHVYSEKPLAIDKEDGRGILELAKEKGLLVGCAPDTFLGARPQTMKKMIDDGWIGRPIAATAFMVCHGHESWHPGPEFYYKEGAGPLFDMGPYYMTALVALLGPAKRISGSMAKTFSQRTITSEPLAGKVVDVDVPTHVSGSIEFAGGAIATVIMSFDVWDSNLPRLEIYGTEGTLSMTDPDPLAGPDIFHGVTKLRRKDEADWEGFPYSLPRKEEATPWATIPSCYDYNENSRGVGLADMARAIRNGGSFRANGEMAYHVLEMMHGFYESAQSGRYYEMQSTCDIPETMPMNLPKFSMGK